MMNVNAEYGMMNAELSHVSRPEVPRQINT